MRPVTENNGEQIHVNANKPEEQRGINNKQSTKGYKTFQTLCVPTQVIV